VTRFRESLARYRVRLGFLAVVAALWLARPTRQSLVIGAAVACVGEALTRHPLYVGSSIMGFGFAIASNSVWTAALAAAYLALTIGAAIRSEERHLTEKFGPAYPEYREGRQPEVPRRFSAARAMRNREYRSVAGLAGVLALLVWKAL
jgi:protein-S-isoprenylcysteine O-methyltransferase Ste14